MSKTEKDRLAVEGDPAMQGLDRLVGTWRVAGEAEGEVSYEWLEGRHFLLQRVDLVQFGQRTTGIEIIGRERPFGAEEPGEDVRSRYYDNLGNTFDYVYDLEGEQLTIWGGERGSPAFYQGLSARTATRWPAPRCTRAAAATRPRPRGSDRRRRGTVLGGRQGAPRAHASE